MEGQNLSGKAKTVLHTKHNKYIGDITFILSSKKMPIMQLDLKNHRRNKIFSKQLKLKQSTFWLQSKSSYS